MNIVKTISLESNRKTKINFNGGDLSSDADFSALFRYHTDKENLLQMNLQMILCLK